MPPSRLTAFYLSPAATAATARDDVPPEIACYLHSRSAHLFSIRTNGLSLMPRDRLPPSRLTHRGRLARENFLQPCPVAGKLFFAPFSRSMDLREISRLRALPDHSRLKE
jgi:hypothetical protein